MELNVKCRPAFPYIDVDLDPGESLVTESDAMTSMSADLDLKARFNGGFFSAILKKLLGNETLMVSEYTNNTSGSRRLTITQAYPGDMMVMNLNGGEYCLQPGAFICATEGIDLGLQWAGFGSFIGREGLFKLKLSGEGQFAFGAYGSLIEKEIDGEYIVDTSHLVGYEPHMKLKVQLAGGIFSSFFGGEGLVTRIEGKGKIIIQSRSLSGLGTLLNRYFY